METQKIDTLQQVINERAAAKLDAHLIEISDYIRGNRLLSDTQIPNLTVHLVDEKGQEKPDTQTKAPCWIFEYERRSVSSSYIASGIYMKRLRDYWLPIYIQEETENFVKLIDQMGEQLDDIQNQVDNLNRE